MSQSNNNAVSSKMQAVRVHQVGGPDAMMYEFIERPAPGPGQVLVRICAAGVGPWDALIRSGKSAFPQPLPLTLGSDFAGIVEDAGLPNRRLIADVSSHRSPAGWCWL